MNTNAIMSKVTGTASKALFQLKKHSPEIMLIGGIAGTITSAVMACKATTKIDTILDETKDTVEKIHGAASGEIATTEPYSEEDAKKDLAIVYVQTGIKLAKLYGPSIILGALSITGIVASNNVLRKRNVALAAAYTAIDRSFKDYRGRVVERFGKEVDHQLKYNIKAVQVEETVTDENGKKKKVKKTVDVVNADGYSDYARFFDVGNPNWEKDSEYNLVFVRRCQAYANEKLRANGRLFLNEVYDMLGIQKTKAGQVVGWVYDEKHPVGDNYVDFGIYGVNKIGDSEASRNFVNGYERSILLDFNVDGNIWEMM